MGGGGGNNNGMMMMQMQQQAAAEQRAREEAAAQRAYQAEKDAYQRKQDQEYAAQQNALREQQEARQMQAEQQQRADAAAALQRQDQQRMEERTYNEGISARQQAQAAQERAEQRAREDAAIQQQQAREQAAAAKEQAAIQANTDKENQTRAANRQRKDSVYAGQQSDADAQLASLGITDPSILAAVKSALGTTYAGISDDDTNPGSYFAGVTDRVLGQQENMARTRYTGEIDKFAGQGFENTRVKDTTDDTILEAILGEQYDTAAADAKRLLDRGVTTAEGYEGNLKALGSQRNTGRAKLTTVGDNELNSQRSKLVGIANSGRSAASAYKLGQQFDPNSYSNQINDSYDSWFKGLDSKLRGVAPTDIFDTAGFLNTAGRISGPTNSPFVGSTNALTGADALADETDPTKKKNAAAPSTMGVF